MEGTGGIPLKAKYAHEEKRSTSHPNEGSKNGSRGDTNLKEVPPHNSEGQSAAVASINSASKQDVQVSTKGQQQEAHWITIIM